MAERTDACGDRRQRAQGYEREHEDKGHDFERAAHAQTFLLCLARRPQRQATVSTNSNHTTSGSERDTHEPAMVKGRRRYSPYGAIVVLDASSSPNAIFLRLTFLELR
jgi:hypothetical protein